MFGGALAFKGSCVLTCCGGTLLLCLMRVKWRLQGDTDGLAKVGDAEDDEYHPLPPVEVPEHLKHVAAFRTPPQHQQKVNLFWRLLTVVKS